MTDFEILQFTASEMAKINQLKAALSNNHLKPSDLTEEMKANSSPERVAMLTAANKKAWANCIKEIENY